MRCYITKEVDDFKMYDDRDNRILLTAKRVNRDFYISQYEDFPESFQPVAVKHRRGSWFEDLPAQSQHMSRPSNNNKRYCGILRLDPSQSGYRLFSSTCDRCDGELCKFACGTAQSFGDPEGRQLLGVIKQSLSKIEQAKVNCRYTEITIPPIKRGGKGAVWCPRTIGNLSFSSAFNNGEDTVESKEEEEDGPSIGEDRPKSLRLKAALPHWDTSLGR